MPDLGSQLACNVMRSVSSMYQSWISNHPKFSTDKKMVLPSISFRNPVVHLDKNTIRFFNNYTEASVYSIWTIGAKTPWMRDALQAAPAAAGFPAA